MCTNCQMKETKLFTCTKQWRTKYCLMKRTSKYSSMCANIFSEEFRPCMPASEECRKVQQANRPLILI